MRFWKSILPVAIVLAPLVVAAPAYAQRNRNQSQAASVIVITYQRVLAESNAGRGLAASLQQIGGQIQQEAQALAPEGQSIEQERQRLEGVTRSMTPEQVRNNAQVQALRTRVEQFEQRRAQLQGDFECTRFLALREFDTAITPVLREVMTARGAGVVLDAGSVQLVQPEFDVTTDLLQRVNTAVTTINVTRHAASECQAQQPPAQ
jgi:Skp family chaperone for outer membrane proteins